MMVKSTKIHKPNAKRLSMLVWFKPLTRHRPAQYTPKRSRAVQGAIHSRKRGVEQRVTPRVMKSLSTCLSTGVLLSESGTRGAGDCAHPIFPGVVINLGIGVERFQHAEAVWAVGGVGDFGGRIVQIAEADGAGGAGFHAGGDVIRRVDSGLAIGDGLG